MGVREENLELGRRFAAAFAARQVPAELLAPGFVMRNVETAVTSKTYRGPEGVAEWFDDFFGVLGTDARYEADIADAGEGWALAKLTLAGSGAASGAPLKLDHWGVLRFSDGLIESATGYATKREALAAVADLR